MEGSFKLQKLVRKQLDLELPSFDWGSIVKQKKLGSGSFDSVHVARHGRSSQNVFIKEA